MRNSYYNGKLGRRDIINKLKQMIEELDQICEHQLSYFENDECTYLIHGALGLLSQFIEDLEEE